MTPEKSGYLESGVLYSRCSYPVDSCRDRRGPRSVQHFEEQVADSSSTKIRTMWVSDKGDRFRVWLQINPEGKPDTFRSLLFVVIAPVRTPLFVSPWRLVVKRRGLFAPPCRTLIYLGPICLKVYPSSFFNTLAVAAWDSGCMTQEFIMSGERFQP